MKLESRSRVNQGAATVALDSTEARALRAALGEICFGFAIPDFNGRVGGAGRTLVACLPDSIRLVTSRRVSN